MNIPDLPLAFLALLAGLCLALPLNAQTYHGRVVEAGSGDPIEGALLRGSPGGYVDLTLADGVFEFGVPAHHRPLTIEVSRQGYATRTFVLDEPVRDFVVELAIAPIQLEGISTELTFEQRLDEVDEALTRRYASHRGIFRSLGRDEIRQFDEAHASDPYAMLSGGLELYFDFNAESDAMRTRMNRRMQFEVFVDEVRVPLLGVLDVPNDQICRAEMFHTTPLMTYDPYREPLPQLRIYTCSFMARVAEGEEEIEDRVCWNELIAWRKPTTHLTSMCTYRR